MLAFDESNNRCESEGESSNVEEEEADDDGGNQSVGSSRGQHLPHVEEAKGGTMLVVR